MRNVKRAVYAETGKHIICAIRKRCCSKRKNVKFILFFTQEQRSLHFKQVSVKELGET